MVTKKSDAGSFSPPTREAGKTAPSIRQKKSRQEIAKELAASEYNWKDHYIEILENTKDPIRHPTVIKLSIYDRMTLFVAVGLLIQGIGISLYGTNSLPSVLYGLLVILIGVALASLERKRGMT